MRCRTEPASGVNRIPIYRLKWLTLLWLSQWQSQRLW